MDSVDRDKIVNNDHTEIEDQMEPMESEGFVASSFAEPSRACWPFFGFVAALRLVATVEFHCNIEYQSYCESPFCNTVKKNNTVVEIERVCVRIILKDNRFVAMIHQESRSID